MTTEIILDLCKISSHPHLISIISNAIDSSSGDNVNIKLNLNHCNELHLDNLVLVDALCLLLKNRNVNISISLVDFHQNNITNLIKHSNFFEFINFNFPDIPSDNVSDNSSVIMSFNDFNSLDVYEKIMTILINKDINENLLEVLHFCLWEVIDNTIQHSTPEFELGNGSGMICIQVIPESKEVRLMIVDTGVGIHYALTRHPQSQFSNYSEEEAILHCIDKGVTNSTGMGFGLYATAEFIRKNAGQMIIYSGSNYLILDQTIQISKGSFWPGTFIFLKINTDIPVDHKEIIGVDSTQADSFNELKNKINGSSLDLW